MTLLKVIINGKERRLSQLALDILGLDKVAPQNKPIAIQKLPPNLEILKIQKAEKVEPVAEKVIEPVAEAPAEPVVEVKKNEDVIVAKDTVKRRRRGKVGTEK